MFKDDSPFRSSRDFTHSLETKWYKQKQALFFFLWMFHLNKKPCFAFALHRNTLSIKSSVQWEQKKWEDARSHARLWERDRERAREGQREEERVCKRVQCGWVCMCFCVGVCCNWRPLHPAEVLRKLFLLQNGNAGKVKRWQHTSPTRPHVHAEWVKSSLLDDESPSLPLPSLSLPLSLFPPSIGSNSECALGERRVFFIIHNNQLQRDSWHHTASLQNAFQTSVSIRS